MSLTEEQKKLLERLRQLLPELFYEEHDARAVLETAGRVRGRQTNWHNPASFWDTELRALQQGAVRDGIPALIIAAVAEYPANEELSAINAEVTIDGQAPGRPPRDEDQDEPPGTEAKPDLGGPVVIADTAGLYQAVNNFPAKSGSPLQPGLARQAWGNVPTKNRGFTGRRKLLAAVRKRLLAGDRVVQALHGIGGVGKTQLAIEYAHRYATDYDVVWWITAAQPGLIAEQVAALGAALGWAEPGTPLQEMRVAVLTELRERERWLLVFDNAENPGDIAEWLPGRSGHVLITSRAPGSEWAEMAVPVQVDVLARRESVALLTGRVTGLAAADAARVAAALGDLPLALVQAAGYMTRTGTTAGEYLELLADQARQLLDVGQPWSYPQSLAAVTCLAFDQLHAEDPAAADLAAVCAFLAPEPIPAAWFPRAAGQLPGPLAAAAADPMAWRGVMARIQAQTLARLDQRGLVMHRLTQAILRDYLPPGRAAAARAAAHAILAASHPGDEALPATWSRWAQLLPHLLAADPDTTAAALSRLTYDTVWYLIRRGDARGGHDLARRLHQHRLDQLGPDDPATLAAAATVGVILQAMGRSGEARELDEDTLARYRRVLGEDDPSTLASAIVLAIDLRGLGEYQAARELDEDTLARCRRVLGQDHRNTLASAIGLAIDLTELGEHQAARDLDEDTLARRRRVLGQDHPSTLASAIGLANDLRALGEHRAARELDEDTLARCRRVLGQDHPTTLASASNLAIDLRALGQDRAARELDEETLARRRRVLGQDHPDTLASASNLANDLHALGEHRAARELDEETLARRRRVLGEDHPDTLWSANNLAADLRVAGQE
jgi:hypothetical protein